MLLWPLSASLPLVKIIIVCIDYKTKNKKKVGYLRIYLVTKPNKIWKHQHFTSPSSTYV